MLGFFMIMNLRFTKRSTDCNGLNSTTFFCRIGFLPCLLLSALIWREIPSLKQLIGIILLVFGMIEMLKSMGCIQISNIIMLFLLTLSGGMIALLNAVYSRYSPPQAQLWFLCIMFIAAFACSVFLLARDKNALRFTSKDLLCGLLIGVMNAVSNLFMLMLSVNSVMLSAPASNMLIAALIGQFFFKEKLNIHTWIALVLTVISLILTNWLRKNDTQTVQKLRRCRQRIGISDICKSG